MPKTFLTEQAKWFPEGSLEEVPAPGDRAEVLGWALEPGDVAQPVEMAVVVVVQPLAPSLPGGSLRLRAALHSPEEPPTHWVFP